ncbi:thioesterase family protein [Arthrobacter sp. NPDC080031]|uniref:thioesterase family protein n=1 Tax=Arthrobacter sp. NPDC080031 TaxID=3155918 RepID=UPI00344D407A
MTSLPTFDQVAALPILAKGSVTPDFIDANGHMNIRHYLEIGADCSQVLCDDSGAPQGYIVERKLGVFTAEHHLRYLGEMRVGDEYTAHARVIDRSDKAVQMLAFLLDRERNRLSNTFETLLIHMDMETRRPTGFPADVAGNLDRMIGHDANTGWDAPLCGVMGVRR